MINQTILQKKRLRVFEKISTDISNLDSREIGIEEEKEASHFYKPVEMVKVGNLEKKVNLIIIYRL
jgi:hypothetical protein